MDKVKFLNFLNMFCNNKKIGNCVIFFCLILWKLGGKYWFYVFNDMEMDLILINIFGSLKSI